jgi:hypothetical protein
MIKCVVIKQFTFKRFDELKNIKRKSVDASGKLLVGDEFECSKEIADYLTGNNPLNEVVVQVVEVEPETKPIEEVEESVKEEIVEPKKSKKKKK